MQKGETIAYIHSNKEELIQEAKTKVKEAYKICVERTEEYKDILNII